jgi:hypothetical protein
MGRATWCEDHRYFGNDLASGVEWKEGRWENRRLELGGEWMSKQISLGAIFVGFQRIVLGIVED